MAATSPEDIAKQHASAQTMVQHDMPCAPSRNHGEISLSWKQQPTEQDCSEEKKEEGMCSIGPCVSSRGRIDVQPLADLVREGYDDKADPTSSTAAIKSVTNLWDESNAAKSNVAVTRPSHDAWGIKKVVLLFCDDFLQDVYEMPWWHSRQDIRAAVQPVLDTLQIPPSRLVRLLLAALPPGVTIPAHHDTGEWVRHTHRVHVPVIVTDPSKILFRCGLTLETMDRIDCTPGHVFEINNQAKHAVSNCGDDHRVHLILDYVDHDFAPRNRILLTPGERVLQTRRSIDRAIDKGKRPTPSYMILGAQKAGTTSLYDYMTQHPLVIPAKRRETHCLDWRWSDVATTVQEHRKHCHSFYYTKELAHHPSCLTGDSTPSYLLDSLRVIPRLKQVFDWRIKFIVMLRDPVRRAQSHYAMVTSQDGTPAQIKTRGTEWHSLSFSQVVQQDMQRMRDCGLIPYWNMETGSVNQELFDSFAGSQEENVAWNRYLKDIPLNTGSHCLVSRGLYELNLRPWYAAFSKSDFLILKLEDMKDGGVENVMERVWRHLELPSYQVKDQSAKNTRSYDSADMDVERYLQRFYEPHNRRLAAVLGPEWNNAWSYYG